MTAPGPAPLPVTLAWMREGTARCRALAAELTDRQVGEACGLPGWTRGHLLTHLARNADALVNLLTWARTGVPTPAYASPAQRAADIEAGAGRGAAQLREDLAASGERLAAAIAAMRPDDWDARVESGQGRELPARQVPWLRTREVWVHAVDLATGTTVADLPGDLVDAMLDDVTTAFAARGDCPPLRLAPADRDRIWQVTGPGDDLAISGDAADLVGWLIGRTGPERLTGPVPQLPAWL